MQHSTIFVRGACRIAASPSASSRSRLHVLGPTNVLPVASISAFTSSRSRSLTAVASGPMRAIRMRKAQRPRATSQGASSSKGTNPMRSRTSEPGSISQKRARSKSGPSAGTATLNRVTATVLLKSPIVKNLLRTSGGRNGDEEGDLSPRRCRLASVPWPHPPGISIPGGRGDWSGGGGGGLRMLVPLGGRGLRLLLGRLLGSGRRGVSRLGGLGGRLGNRGAVLGRGRRRGFGRPRGARAPAA